VALKKMEEKNLEPFLTLMSYQHLFTSSTKWKFEIGKESYWGSNYWKR
jgi:hypothetical protein